MTLRPRLRGPRRVRAPRTPRPCKAFREAESYPGPSLIIAYSHCIAHGYDLVHGADQQKLAVDSGRLAALPLRPAARSRRASRRSSSTPAAPKSTVREYMRNETPLPHGRAAGPEALRRRLRRSAARARTRRAAAAPRSTSSSPESRVPQPAEGAANGPLSPSPAGEPRRTLHGPVHDLPRAPAAAPAHAGRLAAGGRPRHGAAPRGRGRRGDRHALALRGADRRASRSPRTGTSTAPADTFAEALSYFPEPNDFALGPDRVPGADPARSAAAVGGAGDRLAQRHHRRAAGCEYAQAHASRPAPTRSSSTSTRWPPTRTRAAAAVEAARPRDGAGGEGRRSKIPVAVKLSPFYSSLPHFARRLEEAGRRRRRPLQPLLPAGHRRGGPRGAAARCTSPILGASAAPALARHPLRRARSSRWPATGGVHPLDVVKAVMAGAQRVQMVSALLRHGPEHLRTVLDDLRTLAARSTSTSRSPSSAGA